MKRVLALSFALLLSACATQKMSGDQLARVAKDWSLGVRASQVIPVYPLTEDIQPGDVFLVQTPLDEQVKVFTDKGFLPLENLVTRIAVDGYGDFYDGWPLMKTKAPPSMWRFPNGDNPAPADFSRAPLVAFPTYNFSVSRSEGLNVAIPVQGVPIGLNLLNSAAANGTITLKEAYTYALPGKVMFDQLQKWSKDPKIKVYLSQFGPNVDEKDPKKTTYSYLRVVNRVYLVKSVDVTLFSTEGSGAALSGGVPKPVELLSIPDAQKAQETFQSVNTIISKGNDAFSQAVASAAGVAPGGTVKVAMATNRTVSIVETFPRPLAIGYLAFDYRILEDGSLDVPVATFAHLEKHSQNKGTKFECDNDCETIQSWINGDEAKYAEVAKYLKAHGVDRKPKQVLYDGSQKQLRALIVKDVVKL